MAFDTGHVTQGSQEIANASFRVGHVVSCFEILFSEQFDRSRDRKFLAPRKIPRLRLVTFVDDYRRLEELRYRRILSRTRKTLRLVSCKFLSRKKDAFLALLGTRGTTRTKKVRIATG